MQSVSGDRELLEKFESAVVSKTPHLEGGRVSNPTPLKDVSDALIECASSEYGVHLPVEGIRVFVKLDSQITGGSVKVRPAVAIIGDALRKGNLSRGQTVFEATSGNFGIALGMLRELGLDVVALVSRRLQPGVLEKLQSDNVKTVNLDVDICPAPGFKGDVDSLLARGAADSVGRQLEELGFGTAEFQAARPEVEDMLARQDAIGLARLLAKVYHGFCTEQYGNGLNLEVHRTVTGPEIDQDLGEIGTSLKETDVVCAFGTGGTAGGLSDYIHSTYNRKGVRVVFPLSGQDVAGIRTKEKSAGLPFYSPSSYLAEHEVDFEEATKVFEFFNGRGVDVGESGALALYAVMQLINYGARGQFVVMVADGASKYKSEVKAIARKGKRDQVRVEEAASSIKDYGGVIWAHNMFVPTAEGIRVISSSLGCQESEVSVASTKDVQTILNGGDPSDDFGKILPRNERPVLVVCMAGATSLMLARVLERRGYAAESLVGGITGLPASRGKQPFDLVKVAR